MHNVMGSGDYLRRDGSLKEFTSLKKIIINKTKYLEMYQ